MHLKKKTKFYYQSVIVHEDDRISSHFEAEGSRETKNNSEIWTVESSEHGQMRFYLEKDEVHLYHDKSHLKLRRDQRIPVAYQTDYGILDLEGELVQYAWDDQRLKLAYRLYDRKTLISKVYLTLVLR